MRDAMTLQRRRRLMLLQSDTISAATAEALSSDSNHPPLLTATGLETEPDVASLAASRERLFHECRGNAGMQLLVEEPGAAKPSRRKLDQPWLLLGSDPDCDVLIKHPQIAPRHLYLQWVAGELFCSSLIEAAGSKTGKRAAKAPLAAERLPLQIGPCRLSLVGDEPVSASAFQPLDRSPQLATEFPQVRLKFEGVEQADNQWPVDRPLTLIGRGTQCKLRLNHPDLPPVLASLLRTPAGCWLIDLAGQGTTLVNGRAVGFASLDIGDALQLGPFRVTVTAAAFAPHTAQSPRTRSSKPDSTSADKWMGELAVRYRELLGELSEGLREVESCLDIEPLDEAPQLKAALELYLRQANQHHGEMLDGLERFSTSNDPGSGWKTNNAPNETFEALRE